MIQQETEDETTSSIAWVIDNEDKFCQRDNHREMVFFLTDEINRNSKRIREIRRKRIKSHVDFLLSNSTLHGVQYCVDKNHPVRRVIWTVLLFVAMGLLIDKLYASTLHYFGYPFSTQTTIIYSDELVFPAVSFCNLNDYRLSLLNNTLLDTLIRNNSREAMLKLKGDEYQKQTSQASHKIKDMLVECRFVDRPCNADNFTKFYHKQGETCYTFNSGKSGNAVESVIQFGKGNSLEIVLNVQHYDYYDDTADSGIQLILHDQNETPIRLTGVHISPGLVSYVEMRKRKNINLPKPYKTDCGTKPLKYFKTYSMHLCWLESLTDHVLKECGCRDWFMPGNGRVCAMIELYECMWLSWVDFDRKKLYNCPLQCVIDTYVPQVSYAMFPSNSRATLYANELGLSGTNMEKRAFIRDNYLKVVVYYGDLSYDQIEQIPAYDVMVWLGDIGGQLGLFLGSSVLTYLEFFDCLAMVIYAKFFEVIRPKPVHV